VNLRQFVKTTPRKIKTFIKEPMLCLEAIRKCAMTTVLIIDDSLEYLQVLSELLDTIGYNVVLTVEPHRALRLCDDIDFDLILCAIELRENRNAVQPRTSVGVRTLASLREKNPEIPIVATGAVLSEELLAEVAQMGVSEALPRHLPQAAILQHVSRLIGSATA
jgi:CheY-like chemotaxis protein